MEASRRNEVIWLNGFSWSVREEVMERAVFCETSLWGDGDFLSTFLVVMRDEGGEALLLIENVHIWGRVWRGGKRLR